MGFSYEELPDGYDFSSTFDTYILAFCPDTDSWFATNQRFFYYEYPMDFPNEAAAIGYFKRNADVFMKLERDMGVYRPSFYDGGVYLDNLNELVPIKPRHPNDCRFSNHIVWNREGTKCEWWNCMKSKSGKYRCYVHLGIFCPYIKS